MATRAFQATAGAHIFLAVAHTLTAKDWQGTTTFKALPIPVRMKAQAGWYQGSVFFLIVGLLNLRWAKSSAGPLIDDIDKSMALLTTAICWGSTVWYSINGDKATGGVLAAVGALQSWAAFFAS